MTDDILAPAKLDIGRVIQETFGVIGRNFVAFAVLSLLLTGLPLALLNIVQRDAIAGDGSVNFSALQLYWTVIGGLAAMVMNAILQGTLIYATVQDLNGVRPSIAGSLANGLRSFLPLIGVSILFGLAIAAGLVLLIVPGIMIALAWCVAVPSLVAERTGVFGAFTRSAELTRNNRWRILGLFLIVWVALMVIGMVFTAITVGQMAIAGFDARAMLGNPVYVIGNVLVNTISGLIASSGIAVLYVELRRIRDGHGGQWLSEIFA